MGNAGPGITVAIRNLPCFLSNEVSEDLSWESGSVGILFQ